MNIFFWQNCISPHQVPYIRHISDDERIDRVVLIAPRVDYDERKDMGWDAEKMLKGSHLEVYVKPDKKTIDDLFSYEKENTVHLFSGIRGDYETFQFFLQSRSYNLKRGFIQEPPYTYDKPLWAHYIRFFIQDRKFIKDFQYVFAIGDEAVSYFSSWSKKWKVVPFVYCVEPEKIEDTTTIEINKPLSICYVGSLSRRKNVSVLLEAMISVDAKLDIYGDGDKRAELANFVRENNIEDKVTFHGKVNMEDVQSLMRKHDVLVLPSLYDGWGAVVNEALMNGTYAICSDRCGARALLGSEDRGMVFKNDDVKSLVNALTSANDRLQTIRDNRSSLKLWSDAISGPVVAKYMVDNIFKEELQPQPWK